MGRGEAASSHIPHLREPRAQRGQGRGPKRGRGRSGAHETEADQVYATRENIRTWTLARSYAKWLIRNQLKRICARNWPTPACRPACLLAPPTANCDPNTPPIGCGMQTATRTSLAFAPAVAPAYLLGLLYAFTVQLL